MLRTRLIVGSLLIAGLAAIAIIDSSSPILWIGFMRLGPGAILVLLSLFALLHLHSLIARYGMEFVLFEEWKFSNQSEPMVH